MIDWIGRALESLGARLQKAGKSLQNRGYPKITSHDYDTPRPDRDTPWFPGEF
tara:strand:+ start:718 stop:876 length:159 start_codon:yes stop_codon:yes gene_type:complete